MILASEANAFRVALLTLATLMMVVMMADVIDRTALTKDAVVTKKGSRTNRHFAAATVFVDLTILTIEPVTMMALHAQTTYSISPLVTVVLLAKLICLRLLLTNAPLPVVLPVVLPLPLVVHLTPFPGALHQVMRKNE
jgi:hypothetical protein